VRIALSWQLLGLCARLLDVGVEHVKARRQFGQPIGAFQAVQHLLADAAVATASGQIICEAAHADGNGTSGEIASLAAAGAASRALAATSRSVQQVLGAIGYTWEHDLHRYLRRGMVLDLLLDVDDSVIGAAAERFGVPALLAVDTWDADLAEAH
jgi:alkylation response protein AidB-like acyl-CoA dehydrogenase